METCSKCGKRFVVTSWTRDRFWRGICVKCILEFLEDCLGKASKSKRAEFGRD